MILQNYVFLKNRTIAILVIFMILEKETETLKDELIANWIDNFNEIKGESTSLPDYLKNYFLINHVANLSNTIIQVIDMNNFKTIYTSPNCLEITGFTDNELNNTGFTYWLKTIPMKQILFYIKSAQFINQKLKHVSNDELFFSNQCINLAFKNKRGDNRSMISNNSCIEWIGKKQKYQLILWRDVTEKFKNKSFSVRYVIGKNTYHYFSEIAKFKDGDLLTDKELEILQMFYKGNSTKEIAEQMSISSFTVDNHKKNLLSKFETSSMQNVQEICKFIGLL